MLMGHAGQTIVRHTTLVCRVLGLNPGPLTGEGTNTYLVGVAGQIPLLIDTGGGVPGYGPLLAQALAAEDGPLVAQFGPERCLLTHGHPDHMGGLAQLHADFPRMVFYKRPWAAYDAMVSALGAGAVQPLAAGDVVRGAGCTLQVYHTPGHAPDHLCFFLEEERALFVGDMLLERGSVFVPGEPGAMVAYLDSLRRLQALEAQRVYPGHGPPMDDPARQIAAHIDHRLAREAQIVEQLTSLPAGEDVPHLTRRVYGALPAVLVPWAEQTLLSHVYKLAEEGRVILTEGPAVQVRLA